MEIHKSLAVAVLTLLIGAGCTPTSVKVALTSQARADDVQNTVVQNYHHAVKVLLFRDTLAKLNAASTSDARQVVLNKAWNERDLFEWWMLQYERASALRVIGVDSKLYADQSIFDLLYKSLTEKVETMMEVTPKTNGLHPSTQPVEPQ